jgi:hypothetical protein
VTDPTPERNAELAEALGWQRWELGGHDSSFLFRPDQDPSVEFNLLGHWTKSDKPVVKDGSWAPKYSSSLDLMASVEAEIERRGLHGRYTRALERAIGAEFLSLSHRYGLATAPAHVRRDAAIAVLKETR